MKIYTRTGDLGETSLLGGRRVAKDDLRIAAYGDIDELNAALGLTLVHAADASLARLLRVVQRDLFAIGARLADPEEKVVSRRPKAAVTARQIRSLERAIDRSGAALPPLKAFVLPGGSALAAQLHLARTVCRRAERSIVALSHVAAVDRRILAFVNRLSDLLFVLSRQANFKVGRVEERW